MVKKVLLNVIYNLAIIILIFCLFWSINRSFYMLSAAVVFLIALIAFLKIRLIKEVKKAGRK
ncbi:hypothetical protein BDE36_0138 [Arcticibacter tournemirensis]|uniref:Uncharacterized protein n=1 Tax=Arcticibacter tournemirensis TaxID=699437 RepID=A0A4Q0M4U6_9SPHI|nr:hypothetical protein EKH83_17155 [Arcticibacter tournemirensis]TQM48458.1 hypothetical protein BDE36_0138 [Arcticibacter tournemirensis]